MCSRQFRQNFINNINRNDFCLGSFKEVYIYIYSPDQFKSESSTFSVNVKRETDISETPNQIQVPVDNLLGEDYDQHNYHIFVKGYITTSTNKNKYRIVFDGVEGLIPNYVELFKFSNDIILDYKPYIKDIRVGTKVLAPLGYQGPGDLKNKNNTNYNECFKTNTLDTEVKFNQFNIRYMAVVIKKLPNSKVEVMFSINSYESDIKKKTNAEEKKVPFSLSNIRKIYNINDLVVLKKAPLCL